MERKPKCRPKGSPETASESPGWGRKQNEGDLYEFTLGHSDEVASNYSFMWTTRPHSVHTGKKYFSTSQRGELFSEMKFNWNKENVLVGGFRRAYDVFWSSCTFYSPPGGGGGLPEYLFQEGGPSKWKIKKTEGKGRDYTPPQKKTAPDAKRNAL